MKFIKYLLAAVLFGSAIVHAASFDCDKARTRVEKLVCGQAQLGELDERLNAAFTEAKKGLQPTEANRLTQEQMQWLRSARNPCADEACLEKAYTARLNELDPFADSKLTCQEMQRWAARVFGAAIDLGSGFGSPTEVDYRCPDSLSQLTFMQKLLHLAEEIRSDGGPQICTGSIIHAQWRYYQFGLTQAGLAPRTFEAGSSKNGQADWKTFVEQDVTGTATYFQQWSEQSQSNHAVYAEFASEFDQAAAQLVNRYVSQFGMSTAEARSAAKVALGSVVRRAAGSAPKSISHEEFELLTQLRSGPMNRSQIKATLAGLTSAQALQALKVALIYNQPIDVVAALADAVSPAELLDANGTPGAEAANESADPQATPEPLLSLALGNLTNLEYLLRKNVPVNATNGFGKTTLFYAIGASNHDAVELLLQFKANVRHTYKSARELRPNDDECVYRGLEHTRRNTLMHAAQNSDIRMLKILLQAGAPQQARDDLGFNAHDYALMGKNRDNAKYLASLGLEPAAPRYSSEPDPSVREQKLLTSVKVDGYINKLIEAPGRPELLVASVVPWDKLDGGAADGIYVFSIAVPDQPTVLGILPRVYARDFAVSADGKRVYFTELSHQKSPPEKKYGLSVVDIADPARPSLLALIEGDFMTMHLSPDGRTLYLQERKLNPAFSRGLQVYETGVGAPTLKCSNPFGKTSYDSSVFAYGFASFPDEPLLAIADQLRSLLLFDVRDPCAPKKLMETRFDGDGSSITSGPGRTLVTSGLNKFSLGNAMEVQASYAAELSGGFHINNATGLTTALFDKDIAVLRTKPGGTFVLTDRFRRPAEHIGAVVSTESGYVYIGSKGGLGVGVVSLR